jgi:hypothetical protein
VNQTHPRGPPALFFGLPVAGMAARLLVATCGHSAGKAFPFFFQIAIGL